MAEDDEMRRAGIVFDDHDSFEKWLEGKPADFARVLALRTALRVVRQCLHHLEPLAEVTAVGYGAGGGQPLHKQYRPSVIDHKG